MTADRAHYLVGIRCGPPNWAATSRDDYYSNYMWLPRPGDRLVVKDKTDIRLEHDYVPPTKEDNVSAMVHVRLLLSNGSLLWEGLANRLNMAGAPELVWEKE